MSSFLTLEETLIRYCHISPEKISSYADNEKYEYLRSLFYNAGEMFSKYHFSNIPKNTVPNTIAEMLVTKYFYGKIQEVFA